MGWGWPSRVPEQGLLGVRRLVCARARRGLLGHLLVDVPGGHCDPQHGGQCGVVQHDAHLAGERQVSRCRPRTSDGTPTPRAGPRPPARWRPQRRSAVTGSEAQEGTGLLGPQTPHFPGSLLPAGEWGRRPWAWPAGRCWWPWAACTAPRTQPGAQVPAGGTARAWTPGAAGRTPPPHAGARRAHRRVCQAPVFALLPVR